MKATFEQDKSYAITYDQSSPHSEDGSNTDIRRSTLFKSISIDAFKEKPRASQTVESISPNYTLPKEGNEVMVWGSNTEGQLGVGHLAEQKFFAKVQIGFSF